MPHPLVDQLRFARSEWLRGLEGVTEADAARHFGPMNCISWIVGHLAWQEQGYWLFRAQDVLPFPQLHEQFRYGAPQSTPALSDTRRLWQEVTEASGEYLDGLTAAALREQLMFKGRSVGQTVGSALLRMIYHYWYHTGEVQAIRQMLGHRDLPEFVGDLEDEAPYSPE